MLIRDTSQSRPYQCTASASSPITCGVLFEGWGRWGVGMDGGVDFFGHVDFGFVAVEDLGGVINS